MLIMMIISYMMITYVDLKATVHKHSKPALVIYFTMMVISCAYGIASVYISNMPTIADPIKKAVLWVLGK
jgi:uncharacterized membrane protein YesL